MKIQPKVPGVAPTAGADGTAPAERAGPARGFSGALRASKAGAGPDGPGTVGGAVMSRIAERYAAGEITRAEAAAKAAEAAVDAWPAGTMDDASRASAVEEIAEVLSEDPTFLALLEAASSGSR